MSQPRLSFCEKSPVERKQLSQSGAGASLWILFWKCHSLRPGGQMSLAACRNDGVSRSWRPLCKGIAQVVCSALPQCVTPPLSQCGDPRFNSHSARFNPLTPRERRWSIRRSWPSLLRLMSPSSQGPLNWRTTIFLATVSTWTLESH